VHAVVIAEIGSCHDGSLDKAKRLVRAAAAAGADVVKGQWWSSPDRLADRRGVPPAYREIYRRYRMPTAWLPILQAECHAAGVEWACTTYLPEDVATIEPFVERFKISSFEAFDRDFLEAHLEFRKPLIVSVGMADDQEPYDVGERFLERSRATGLAFQDLHLLHCVSAYPAPLEAYALSVLRRWSDPYDGIPGVTSVGVSDHSGHIWMGGLAVAAGAQIIEAHLRLDDTDPQNPDFRTAFTPHEFKTYVRNIRLAEVVTGDGAPKRHACEDLMVPYRVGVQTT